MNYPDFDQQGDCTGSYDDPIMLRPRQLGPVPPYPGRPPLEALDPLEAFEEQAMARTWIRLVGLAVMVLALATLRLSQDPIWVGSWGLWELGRTLWAVCGLVLILPGLAFIVQPGGELAERFPTHVFALATLVFLGLYGIQKGILWFVQSNIVGLVV